MKGKFLTVWAVALSLVMVIFTIKAIAEEIPRIKKEDLQAMLGNPDLIILDVRHGSEWMASQFKIAGAVWEDARGVEFWAYKYPKDKILVLYCA